MNKRIMTVTEMRRLGKSCIYKVVELDEREMVLRVNLSLLKDVSLNMISLIVMLIHLFQVK